MRQQTKALLARSERGKTLIRAVEVANELWPWYLRGRDWVRARRQPDEGPPKWAVVIEDSDGMYHDVKRWLADKLDYEDERVLHAVSTEVDSWGDRELVRKRGSGEHGVLLERKKAPDVWLDVGGHRVHASVSTETLEDDSVKKDSGAGAAIVVNMGEGVPTKRERIVFVCEDKPGREAVVEMLDHWIAEKYRSKPRTPRLFMPSYGGHNWMGRQDMPVRDLESVILKAGQAERIVADVQEFLDAEEWYGRTSQPWHRGYLFWGEPGTGKTSAARAIAAHFVMDVYYLPLADVEKDADLVELIKQVDAGAILLLEDVDAFSGATGRKEKDKKATISAMLNALDGIFTPHGMVTIMTTNHKDALDPALIRSGRVDAEEEFTALDDEQAARLAAYLEVDGLDPAAFVGKSPADMTAAAVVEKRRPRELKSLAELQPAQKIPPPPPEPKVRMDEVRLTAPAPEPPREGPPPLQRLRERVETGVEMVIEPS